MDKGMVKGIAAGVLGGAAVGAGLALLFAPQSGRKTRRDIQRRADEMKSRAGNLGNSIKEKVGSVGHSMGGNGSGEAEA